MGVLPLKALLLLALQALCVLAGADYYAVLGVPRDADEATIKKSYRKLSLKYHPGEDFVLRACSE